MHIRVCDSPLWPAELGEAWRSLAEDSPEATPFQTWEWQSSWWSQYGRGKRAHIALFHEGSHLVGLMPLVRTSGPWTALRAMGGGPSDYLHPLARPGYEEAVAEHLVEHVRSVPGIDLIDLHQVRDDRVLARALPESTAMAQARCLVLDLPSTYDAFLQTLSKSLRYDARRMDKPAFAAGGASIRTLEADEIAEGLDAFFETHRMRWRKRGLPGAFVGQRIQRFHRDWASLAAAKGWIWLSVLELEGRTVGTLYAMRLGETCYFYQAGFDPVHSAMSPGTVLVAHTVRRAIEHGVTRFDFLRGDEPYKRRWKPQHAHENLRYLEARGSLRGRLAQGWNETGARVEGKIRDRLEGKSLR
ncbi:MAG: GNAT family N-acetyltransferase [Fimbriimonadaceae bacterium]|nr:GNAT family N-acetyltransferase [Fimbriimonadaceae bacterium]